MTSATKAAGAPRWLLIATVFFTLLILAMAVAETTLWMHFLVDRGEYISIGGLAFIFLVGVWLYSRNRLKPSLPLFIPWLIYPVLTQGDELIDNLTINQMRLVCHVILAVLFGAPILMIALTAARVSPVFSGKTGRRVLVALLFAGEIWVAVAFLGDLMVLTLILMGIAYVYFESAASNLSKALVRFTEKAALVVMVVGVVGSLGIFIGFKNRPGAYQGSPAAYLDHSQKDAHYDFNLVAAGKGEGQTVPQAEIQSVFADYSKALLYLNHAHYVMDRNYNYTFHNSLFLRHTPILPSFREKSIEEVSVARRLAASADTRTEALIAGSGEATALGRLLQEVRDFTSYNLRRASLLDMMSAEFIKTEAGAQHATHLYEGEGKLLDDQFAAVIRKHDAEIQRLGDASAPLVEAARLIHSTYGNRIVGF
jgi:hypothetical protein